MRPTTPPKNAIKWDLMPFHPLVSAIFSHFSELTLVVSKKSSRASRKKGFFKQFLERVLTPAAITPAGIVVAVAFRAGGAGIVDRVAVGAGGAVMREAAAPAAGLRMVKVGIPVAGAMALRAGAVELPDMRGRLGVAGSAGGRRAGEDIIHVAFDAGHANMCARQWEGDRRAEIGMREMRRVDESQCSRRTAVIRVTAPARTAHSALDERTVQSCRIGLLGGYVAMTIYAQSCHACRAPEGRMAGATTRPNRCMRCDTSERLACLGTERPGHEKKVAPENHQACQNDNCQCCDDDARAGDETGTRIIHHSS